MRSQHFGSWQLTTAEGGMCQATPHQPHDFCSAARSTSDAICAAKRDSSTGLHSCSRSNGPSPSASEANRDGGLLTGAVSPPRQACSNVGCTNPAQNCVQQVTARQAANSPSTARGAPTGLRDPSGAGPKPCSLAALASTAPRRGSQRVPGARRRQPCEPAAQPCARATAGASPGRPSCPPGPC